MTFWFEFPQESSLVGEAISNTRKNVSSDFQTARSWLKKSSAAPRVGNRIKHSSSCSEKKKTFLFWDGQSFHSPVNLGLLESAPRISGNVFHPSTATWLPNMQRSYPNIKESQV